MYARTYDQQELTFVVSGMLWQQSLVMRDLETKSLWSHLLGKCMDGDLQGARLETLPALLTDWQTWNRTHPETTVMLMRRSAHNFTRDMYRQLGDFVVGMSDGKNSKSWSFRDLNSHPLINDTFAEQPIVIAYQIQSATPFVFDRRVDQKTFTFIVKDGKIFDQETGSSWDLEFGVATDGEMKGKKLKALVAISSFRRAWSDFHPGSERWKPEK